MSADEGYKGLGRRERRRLIQRWKAEGQGMSLKDWARSKASLVGDSAKVWIENKRNLKGVQSCAKRVF